MKTGVVAVYEFNKQVLGIEPRQLGPMTEPEREKLIKQLNEEVIEFADAHREEDLVKTVDALLDNIYFAIGGLYRMGVTPDQVEACFLAINDANMTKKKGEVKGREVVGAVDAMKPEGWKPPEERIAAILFETE